ncbi:hypothetical protein THAOC_12248, partial [Thalassiosira oceanica]
MQGSAVLQQGVSAANSEVGRQSKSSPVSTSPPGGVGPAGRDPEDEDHLVSTKNPKFTQPSRTSSRIR